MTSVEFSTTDFRVALRELYAGIRNNAHGALKTAIHVAHEAAASTTLFKDRSGETRASIAEEMTGPLSGKVTAGGAARFINDGTPPHIIRGRRGGMLHFQVDGYDFYRRVVHHPGTQPRPFMGEAADAGEQSLEWGLEIGADKAIEHFNAGG